MFMLFTRPIGAAFALLALTTATSARAASDDSAARSASDAFGEKVGIDSVGLYSENGTRGFDLIASSAAFRVDGFYFQPASALPETLLQGSSVNVGIAATALDLPSPTGVVTYRLLEPAPADGLQVTAGRRDASAHVSARATLTDKDRGLSLVGDALYEPHYIETAGGVRPYVAAALVGRWQPDPGTRVEAFGAYIGYWHDSDISVLADGPGVPPPLPRFRRMSPGWARTSYEGGNVGLLATHDWGRWSAGLGLIHSVLDRDRSDIALLSIDRTGQATSTLFYTPAFSTRSDSAEAKVARTISLFGAEHRIGLAVRDRDTRTGRAEAVAYDTGRFLLADGPPDTPEPDLPAETARGSDRVNQRIASATYGLQWRDRIQLRLGAHASHYAKTVDGFDGSRGRSVESNWLYSASLIWQPTPRFRLFASRVSGLEETGSAPNAALNRGEVLPPVKARQSEVGARYEIARGLNLIVAGFDISKPVYGLRPDNFYAPIGIVRHCGVEASLAGRLGPDTTIVLGGNLLAPRLSGPLVDAGAVERVAPGVSRVNATISVDQQLTRRWSTDAYLIYEGPRRRDQTSRTMVPGVPFATIGTRYNWTWGKTPLSFRAQMVNALDRRGYYATPYGALAPISPVDYRLLLSADF
jgi:iron complex outermembrane receptor protein